MSLRDRVAEALTPDVIARAYGVEIHWSGHRGRARRCPRRDHRDRDVSFHRIKKVWQCFACADGGDLFHWIGAFEGLDTASDFPMVLQFAAALTGVLPEDDWNPSPHRAPLRPPPAPEPSIGDRLMQAQSRARWLWSHLQPAGRDVRAYLASRGLDLDVISTRIELKSAPADFRRDQIEHRCAELEAAGKFQSAEDLRSIFRSWRQHQYAPGVCMPVFHTRTGGLVDVRVRRYDWGHGPRVLGMVGGVSRGDGELIGCYGLPHALPHSTRDVVIVVEGLADTLTALQLWPEHDVLGAVDASSYPLVAEFAAAHAYARGARVVLVAQHDGPEGAAALAVDHAAAAVIAGGAGLPIWLPCEPYDDLNAWHIAQPGEPATVLANALREA